MKLPTGSGPLSTAIRDLAKRQKELTPRSVPGSLTNTGPYGTTARPIGFGRGRRTTTAATGRNVWL